jgi:DNA primase
MIDNLNDIIVEVKDRCNIVDVVSDFVKLKKTGQNYQGLCPFHIEKTPSFSVNEKKGIYHCFGCGVGGDVINFIMRYHNIDFLEAIEMLAIKYGINISKNNDSFRNYRGLYDLHSNFAKLAIATLNSKKGIEALEYLLKRGLNKEIIETFELGYISDRQDFSKILSSYNTKTIKESGIFVIRNGSYLSRFNGRIVIPIKDKTGKIIAFSGRSIHGEQPKYINSPETSIFRKRETLFNLDNAKKDTNKMLFLVEGYFDAIVLSVHGFTPAVCTMGTSLSNEHVKILKNYFKEVLLIFDGDSAGKKAAIRALNIFIQGDFIPHVVYLPENEDPDSFLRKNGSESFAKLINNKEDLFISFVKEQFMNAKNDINSKVNVIERCKEMLMSIKNPYRKNFYMKEVVKICEIDEEVLLKTTDLNKAMLPSNKGKVLGNIKYICEMDFIGSLFELSDETVQSLVEDLDENYFNDEDMKKIFKKIIENLGKGININILIGDKDIGNIVSSLMVNSEDDRDFYLIAIRNKNKLIYNYLNKKKKEMLLALSSMINEDKRKDILESLSQLVNKQKKLYTHLLEE